MKKRLIAFVLAFSILISLFVSMVSINVFALKYHTEGDWTYQFESAGVEIVDYSGPGGDITIPSTFWGYNVKLIGESAFYGYTSINSITIPSGISIIAKYAFSNCKAKSLIVDSNNLNYSSNGGVLLDKPGTTILTCPEGFTGSYSIPNSVTNIRDNAFSECSLITNIDIPETVTSIGSSAFYGCTSLSNLTFISCDISLGTSVFASCTNLTIYCYPGSSVHTYAQNFGLRYILFQYAPTGLIGIAPKSVGGSDGKILGSTTDMEYKLSSDTTYQTVTSTEITGLSSGTYNIRYKARTGYFASPDTIVVIGEGYPRYSVCGNINEIGVTVTISTFSVIANESGYFSFSDIVPGSYNLYISRQGAITRTIEVTVSDQDIDIQGIDIILGDANDDGFINISDITKVKNVFGETFGSMNYSQSCDMVIDDSINISDITTVKSNFGKTVSLYQEEEYAVYF